MRIRLEPSDEYPHQLTDEPTFNESVYVNVVDAGSGIGAFVRMGNRPNEGRGEMTVCVYLPDPPCDPPSPGGPVAFMFQRPEVHDNAAFDAAGLSFETITPFEELRVRYAGKLLLLADPMALADPRRAFTENPFLDGRIDWTLRRASDPFGGEPEEQHERPGEEFARGHYEQLVSVTGEITVGEQTWAVDGFGLRDHSWGPRTWQAPFYYRWLTANVGGETGFMASRIARRDRDGTRAGFWWENGQMRLIDDVRIRTTWDDQHHRALTVTLRRVGDDDTFDVAGEVLAYAPLRNRRDGSVTRIGEGLTQWRLPDGRVGYGLSEYLDQIVDDVPVGLDE